MKKRDIFDRLNAEFDELAPEASPDLVKAPIIAGPPCDNAASALRKREKRSPFTLRRITAAAAALAVTAGVATTAIVLLPKTVTPGGYIQNDTFISLSINPALSVVADSDGKVVEIATKNRDAEILIAGTDKTELIGKDYGYVVKYLTGEAVALGYFAVSAGMNVAAVSCGGGEKTARIVDGLKTEAESVLAASGITVPVTVSILDRGGLLAEASRIDPRLQGDEDLSDLLEVLASDKGYMKKFGGEIADLFGTDADKAAQTLYEMELLDEYADLLEDRREFFDDLSAFNAELAADETVTAVYAAQPGAFTAPDPDGWWLSWYVNYNGAGKGKPAKEDGENEDEEEDGGELAELADEFAELFEDYGEYGLSGLEPLLAGGKPNVGAGALLGEYLAVYGTVDFEELEEYADELEDLLDDLDETNYGKIAEKFEGLRTRLDALGADWEEFASSRGDVGDLDDYLQKTAKNFEKVYNEKKNSAGAKK